MYLLLLINIYKTYYAYAGCSHYLMLFIMSPHLKSVFVNIKKKKNTKSFALLRI